MIDASSCAGITIAKFVGASIGAEPVVAIDPPADRRRRSSTTAAAVSTPRYPVDIVTPTADASPMGRNSATTAGSAERDVEGEAWRNMVSLLAIGNSATDLTTIPPGLASSTSPESVSRRPLRRSYYVRRYESVRNMGVAFNSEGDRAEKLETWTLTKPDRPPRVLTADERHR